MRSTRSLSWTRRLFGFEPLPVPPHVFALGEERLRYGRLERGERRRGLEFREYAWSELPADLFTSGPLGGVMRDPGLLAAALQELLERLSGPVREASLVLPDAWLRLTFAEVGSLPRAPAARDEVLRWKLRRLVPFRVEELRIAGVEVTPLAHQEEPRRVLLGFAIEPLLRQLEETFDAAGVRLGQISSESLSLVAAVVDALRDVELGAVAQASAGGYSLAFLRHGEPVLHRFKAMRLPGDAAVAETMVLRDLRLTRAFLEEQVEAPLGRLLVLCPEEARETWLRRLGEAFELPAFVVGREHLPAAEGEALPAPIHEAAALYGAARQRVA